MSKIPITKNFNLDCKIAILILKSQFLESACRQILPGGMWEASRCRCVVWQCQRPPPQHPTLWPFTGGRPCPCEPRVYVCASDTKGVRHTVKSFRPPRHREPLRHTGPCRVAMVRTVPSHDLHVGGTVIFNMS